MKKSIELFLTFMKIGAFTFGGGYAMIPLIQKEVCENKKWLSEKDISDIASKIDFQVFSGALEAGGSVRAVCIPGGAKFSRKEIDALGEV